MVAIYGRGCHESAGFDDASNIGGATEVNLVEDFHQQLQASGVPVQEVHVMPVGKFEKLENAMNMYNSAPVITIALAEVAVEEEEVVRMAMHLPNA